jgi:hypothetical protein
MKHIYDVVENWSRVIERVPTPDFTWAIKGVVYA